MLHALGKEGYHLTHTPGKQDVQSIDQQAHTGQEYQAAAIHPIVASQPTPSPQNTHEPNKRWYRRIPWWKLLEGLGIVGVIWYAGITHLQWRDLRHNFEANERAWISIEYDGIPDIDETSVISSLK